MAGLNKFNYTYILSEIAQLIKRTHMRTPGHKINNVYRLPFRPVLHLTYIDYIYIYIYIYLYLIRIVREAVDNSPRVNVM